MIDLPAWLLDKFDKSHFSCPSCKADFHEEGCVLIGIKDISNNNKSKKKRHALYMEYKCPECHERTAFEIKEMDLEEFAYDILEYLEKQAFAEADEILKKSKPKYNSDANKKAKKKTKKSLQSSNKSKITKEEQASALKMLDKSKTWQDWLNQIGAEIKNKAIDERERIHKIGNIEDTNE